jgi:sugar phosphate isomerase/epimerase
MGYEFSCHTWGFNDLTLMEALGTIARMGFRYVDIGTGAHLNLSQLSQSRHRQQRILDLIENLQLFNLQVADLYLMFPRISVDDDKKRETDIALFKALLPIARAINARGVTISTGLIHPEDDVEAYQRTIASLREMTEYAESREIPLSIEPHLDSMAQTPKQTLKILDDVQGLDITLDWAQLVCQNINDKDIQTLLPRTRHIHIRQAARNQLQVPYKRGRIKPEKVIEYLNQADYQGNICIEYMQMIGWHGMVEVDNVIECVAMRDALRDERDEIVIS